MPAPTRRRLGNLLIWIGVLAWAPFFYFSANRIDVSIVPFLSTHLAGVLGGAWLRRSADRLEGLDRLHNPFGRQRVLISKVMIYLGVLAWAPYFFAKNVLGEPVPMAPFLTAHLIGVLGGAALRASVEVQRYLQRDTPPGPPRS